MTCDNRRVQRRSGCYLLANDPAGDGVDLQRRPHLMANYDLVWNPNRLEQRFGRINRIGQTEVCHFWNFVVHEMRKRAVYEHLFEKLETARGILVGTVEDVGFMRYHVVD